LPRLDGLDLLEGIEVTYLQLLLRLKQTSEHRLELLEVEGESENGIKEVRISH
jgi:hypothetical protein